MHHTLESYKIFPYIAWGLVVGFALFTYFLTVRVQQELEDIGDGVARLETRLNTIDTTGTKSVQKEATGATKATAQ